jgi:ribonuclease P protein component
MNNRFTKKLRLTTSHQFKQIFQNSKKISSKVGAVFFCQNSCDNPRLGVVASKKNIKLASKRNCFKRQAREIFRLSQNDLGNIDIVVFAYKGAETLDQKELRQSLKKLWQDLTSRLKSC